MNIKITDVCNVVEKPSLIFQPYSVKYSLEIRFGQVFDGSTFRLPLKKYFGNKDQASYFLKRYAPDKYKEMLDAQKEQKAAAANLQMAANR